MDNDEKEKKEKERLVDVSHVEAALDHVGDHIIDDGLHGVLSFSSTAREGLGVVRLRRAFSWKLERQRVCRTRNGGLLARVCVDTSSPTSRGVATPYLLSGPLLISPNNSSSHLWGFIAPSTEYNKPPWDESRASQSTHATKQPPTMLSSPRNCGLRGEVGWVAAVGASS